MSHAQDTLFRLLEAAGQPVDRNAVVAPLKPIPMMTTPPQPWPGRNVPAATINPRPHLVAPLQETLRMETVTSTPTAALTPASPTDRLIYWRCLACLEPYTVPESLGKVPHPCHDFNTVDHVELMGPAVIDHDRHGYTTEVSACDGRCTSAIGPLCVCKCRCANHGSGRTIAKYHELPKVKRDEHTRLANLWHHEQNEAITLGRIEKRRLVALSYPTTSYSSEERNFIYQGRRLGYRMDEMIVKSVKARTLKARAKAVADLMAAIAEGQTKYPDPAAVAAAADAAKRETEL